MNSHSMPANTKILKIFPFLLVFYEIINYLANDMYLPALPSIVHDLATNAQYAQLTLTTWFLGTASMQLLLGPLSDRFGRRPVLLGGGLLFIVSTLVCALTPNIKVLLVARFFQGCVVGSVITAGYSTVHECYDQKQAIHLLAIMGSLVVLGPAFGPLIGSFILQGLNWRWIFGILVICALLALSLLWVGMPESNPKEKQQLLDWKLLSRNYWALLSNPKFMLNTLIICLNFLVMITWIAAGPFLVVNTFKFNTLFFGLFQAIIFGGLIVGAQQVKHLLGKLGINRLVNRGLTITCLSSIIALIITFIFPRFLLGLVLALTIFTFGASLAFSPLQRMAIEASTEPMGARIAVFSTLMTLFGVLGSFLVSIAYTGTLTWFAVLLVLVAGATVLSRWLELKLFKRCVHRL